MQSTIPSILERLSRGNYCVSIRAITWLRQLIPVCRIGYAIPADLIPREPPTGASCRAEGWRRPGDPGHQVRHSRPCRVRGSRSRGRRPEPARVKAWRSGAARDDVFRRCAIHLEKRCEFQNLPSRTVAPCANAAASGCNLAGPKLRLMEEDPLRTPVPAGWSEAPGHRPCSMEAVSCRCRVCRGARSPVPIRVAQDDPLRMPGEVRIARANAPARCSLHGPATTCSRPAAVRTPRGSRHGSVAWTSAGSLGERQRTRATFMRRFSMEEGGIYRLWCPGSGNGWGRALLGHAEE
jgi:hypothetical protein